MRAQPRAVQPHAALGDQLCGRAHVISVDLSPKKSKALFWKEKKLHEEKKNSI